MRAGGGVGWRKNRMSWKENSGLPPLLSFLLATFLILSGLPPPLRSVFLSFFLVLCLCFLSGNHFESPPPLPPVLFPAGHHLDVPDLASRPSKPSPVGCRVLPGGISSLAVFDDEGWQVLCQHSASNKVANERRWAKHQIRLGLRCRNSQIVP